MEDETEPITGQLEFTIERASDYRIMAANGCWVAITPRGDLKIDFMVECDEIPSVMRQDLKGGRIGGPSKSEFGEISIKATRRLEGAVLLTMTEAKALASLINQKVELWQKVQDQNKQL